MRMMVVFEKGPSLRYIGHLDLMRAMQRALRRSCLPVKYSNGFNPHIRLSFAAPLSVGVVGLREMMEVPVEDGVTEAEFVRRMNQALPNCLQIRECRRVEDTFPALMALMAGSDYRIAFPKTPESGKAVQAFERFMALDGYVANRRTKSGDNPCDIRPFVLSGSCTESEEGYQITLRTVTTRAGALKPALWLKCLCEFAGCCEFPHIIYRTAVLTRDGQGRLVPMETVE